MPSLTEMVREKSRELGGDLFGVAPVERFRNAPLRMSPQGLLPTCRNVVVVGIHHPDAVIELDGEPTSHDMSSYALQSTGQNSRLDDISFLLARYLEDLGHTTLPISASNIWRYKGYKDLKVDFAPDIAHRYAAVAAGMGEIGWNGLCLTPEFGPRNRFVSVITEAELDPSPMYSGEPLCDKCMACVKNCPTDAFRKEVREMAKIEIAGRTFEFPLTSKWRCAWAENFGLDLSHPLPEKIDEETILRYMETYGRRGGEMGSCLRFCMNPQQRYYQADYSRAPRRKKDVSSTPVTELQREILRICASHSIDIVAVEPRATFTGNRFVHPEYHLPDVATVMCLGVKYPTDWAGNPDVARIISRRLIYAAFQVAHYLDIQGYSATTSTRIADNLVAEHLGIYGPEMKFLTVLTSATFPALRHKRSKAAKRAFGPEQIREYCRKAGADLVGFFGKSRYDKFRRALEASGTVPATRSEIEDVGHMYGPFVPRVTEKELRIRTLEDWLPGAKSVIVLGIHYPDATLDTAKVTPAESVGPFAFIQEETFNILGDCAYDVIRRLDDAGYRSTFCYDLTGIASKERNCRRNVPDMRANMYPAILGGLAYQGANGYPITERYGVRQRWVAIVTDCELPDDPLYKGVDLCASCSKPCIAACPTRALSQKSPRVSLKLGRDEIRLYTVDEFACDWAKTYALNAHEGPEFYGVPVDVPLPKKRDAAAVVAAVSGTDWGVQKRHINVAEECLRVCPAKGRR